jgi:hypothetical protein
MSLFTCVWDHAIQSVENFGNFGKIQVMRTWAAAAVAADACGNSHHENNN